VNLLRRFVQNPWIHITCDKTFIFWIMWLVIFIEFVIEWSAISEVCEVYLKMCE
jgi:hypothetical protein